MAILPPDPISVLRSDGGVYSLCFYKNDTLFAGTERGTIHLWNLQTNRSSFHFDGSNTTSPITSLHHSDDYLISQDKGGDIKFWVMNNSGYKLKKTIECNHCGYCRTDFMPENNMLVYPRNQNDICVVSSLEDLETMQILNNDLSKNLGNISCLRIVKAREQYYILAGYESKNLLMWDTRSNKLVGQIQLDEIPFTIDYDSHTNRGICGGLSENITVFSFSQLQSQQQQQNQQSSSSSSSLSLSSSELCKKSEIKIKNAGIHRLRIRNDKKIFASAGWDGKIRIFSWKSLRPLAVLTEHRSGNIMDICFSTDTISLWKAPIMAAAGMDGQITLWDLYN